MAVDAPPEAPVVPLACRSCQALNLPNAMVCAGCGVRLAAYEAAAPAIAERESEVAAERSRDLAGVNRTTARREVARSRRRLLFLLGIAIALGLVILGIGAALTYAQAERSRARDARLAAEYARAVDCQEGRDYVCARDRFVALLGEQRGYADARERLHDVRLALARQYATAGRWQLAVAELDALLDESPTDQAALALLRDVYDRWLADATGRSDWWTAWKVGLQRDARFPPLAPPTPESDE